MKLPHIARAFTTAFLLMAAGLAQADVTRCADAEGELTYTDAPCQSDETSAPVSGPLEPAPPKLKAPLRSGKFAAAEDARVATWAVTRATGHRLPVDSATLKTANASLVLSDRVAAEARRQIVPQRRSWLFASVLY